MLLGHRDMEFACNRLQHYSGGIATSEWLEARFSDFLGQHWSDGQNPQADITKAFLQVVNHA